MNRQELTSRLFRWLGKDPEAVIVSFCAGSREECERMLAEVRELLPDRRHLAVRLSNEEPLIAPGVTVLSVGPEHPVRQLRHVLRPYRIGLAPTRWISGHPIVRAALLLAPTKVLAYNDRLERHHLRATTPIASYLFTRGVPLDRIFLRPRWLPLRKHSRSRWPSSFQAIPARGPRDGFPRVAVFTPYAPYPLSHGGAVRMFALLKEAAAEFDIYLFWFSEGDDDPGPLAGLCAGLFACESPYYREPRWSTLTPPDVLERWSPSLQKDLDRLRRAHGIQLVQLDYTQLARYRGDILVEHDITFDLFRQLYERQPSRSHWWDWHRWRRFEQRVTRRFRRVVVMSEKDSALLPAARTTVIPNGVDLERFTPSAEAALPHLLFVGSFRHFPNIAAYCFFVEHAWTIVKEAVPGVRLTVIAGPEPMLYWRAHTGTAAPVPDDAIEILGFTADVRPLYRNVQVVLVPTTVSAGTNLKVLEAMAMQRAVVSTTSGCAGLDVTHEEQLLIADRPEEFAAAVVSLLRDDQQRAALARRGREHVERHFDWHALGQRQRELWRSLLP